jgi:hypothetical protein
MSGFCAAGCHSMQTTPRLRPMSSADFPDWQLIDRYLAGEASPAERERIQEICHHPGVRAAAPGLLDEQRLPPEPVGRQRRLARFAEASPSASPGYVRADIPRPGASRAPPRRLGLPAAWMANRRNRMSFFPCASLHAQWPAHDSHARRQSRVSLNSRLRFDASFGKRIATSTSTVRYVF